MRKPADRERVRYELRYRGQSFELPIDTDGAVTPEQLRELFEAEHESRYGFRDADAEIELVTVRVSVFGEAPSIELARGGTQDAAGVIRLDETTVLVPEHWTGEVDEGGTVTLWTR